MNNTCHSGQQRIAQRHIPQGPRSLYEIERDVLRGKHVRPSDLNRFARSPRGAMMLHQMCSPR